MHHVKRAGEFVLMDGRRPVHPKQELDVESRMAVHDEFGLAERRIGLNGLLVIEQEIAHEAREIRFLRRRAYVEGCAGDLREFRERKVFSLPTLQDRLPKLLEQCLHWRTL